MNIGLRSGVLSQQHRKAMGPAWHLFAWAVMRQTNPNGAVLYDHAITYSLINHETGWPVRTIKRWMQRLRGRYLEVVYNANPFLGFHLRVMNPKKFSMKQKEIVFPRPPQSSTQLSTEAGPKVARLGATSDPAKEIVFNQNNLRTTAEASSRK